MNEISAYVLPVLKVFDKDIIDAVCKVYNISPKHIFISSRRRGITEPRQIVTSLIMLLSERGQNISKMRMALIIPQHCTASALSKLCIKIIANIGETYTVFFVN